MTPSGFIPKPLEAHPWGESSRRLPGHFLLLTALPKSPHQLYSLQPLNAPQVPTCVLRMLSRLSWAFVSSRRPSLDTRSGCCRCACSVTQSCLTLCDSMDCSSPGSSVHRISQAKMPPASAPPKCAVAIVETARACRQTLLAFKG